MDSAPDYIRSNRTQWARWAVDYATRAESAWRADPTWGIWHVPESEVGLLDDVEGLDVLEVGCGTGYVSSWLARRGARPVGLDPTREQLATAAAMQERFDVRFPLVMAAGEGLPFADESFDYVISEYGSAIWSDPYRWIPEAGRVLRPGGRLSFLVNGSILMLCMPELHGQSAGTTLIRDYFGMHRFEWPEDPSVEFHLGHGDWIRLLRDNGFDVDDLVELRPNEGSTSEYDFVTLEWARRWPSEEVWKACKTGR